MSTTELTKIFNLRMTNEQHLRIKEEALAAGLSASDYARARLIDQLPVRRPKRADRAELARILGQIGSLGGNVNQLARHANRTAKKGPAELPGKSQLEEIHAEVLQIRNDLLDALGVQFARPENLS